MRKQLLEAFIGAKGGIDEETDCQSDPNSFDNVFKEIVAYAKKHSFVSPLILYRMFPTSIHSWLSQKVYLQHFEDAKQGIHLEGVMSSVVANAIWGIINPKMIVVNRCVTNDSAAHTKAASSSVEGQASADDRQAQMLLEAIEAYSNTDDKKADIFLRDLLRLIKIHMGISNKNIAWCYEFLSEEAIEEYPLAQIQQDFQTFIEGSAVEGSVTHETGTAILSVFKKWQTYDKLSETLGSQKGSTQATTATNLGGKPTQKAVQIPSLASEIERTRVSPILLGAYIPFQLFDGLNRNEFFHKLSKRNSGSAHIDFNDQERSVYELLLKYYALIPGWHEKVSAQEVNCDVISEDGFRFYVDADVVREQFRNIYSQRKLPNERLATYIAAEMVHEKTGLPKEHIQRIFNLPKAVALPRLTVAIALAVLEEMPIPEETLALARHYIYSEIIQKEEFRPAASEQLVEAAVPQSYPNEFRAQPAVEELAVTKIEADETDLPACEARIQDIEIHQAKDIGLFGFAETFHILKAAGIESLSVAFDAASATKPKTLRDIYNQTPFPLISLRQFSADIQKAYRYNVKSQESLQNLNPA